MVEQEAALRIAEANARAIAVLQKQLGDLGGEFAKLRRFAPPVSEKRKRRVRVVYEVAGVAIASTGAWWVYPPAALLLVGAWMLVDVLGWQNQKKRKAE